MFMVRLLSIKPNGLREFVPGEDLPDKYKKVPDFAPEERFRDLIASTALVSTRRTGVLTTGVNIISLS
jgi:hypothetical protein